MVMSLDQETERKLQEIKKRWEDDMKNVCEKCMYTAWSCYDQDSTVRAVCKEQNHPNRHSGDLYSYAGGDIATLLKIIDEIRR